MERRSPPDLPVIGWREWVGLPELGVKWIKAKVDSGARSSSLHTFDLRQYDQDGKPWVRFKIHPLQRSSAREVEVAAKVLEFRSVRSSSGKAAVRPVIISRVRLRDLVWSVELTLANRDTMGFRMLLGREAFRGRFLVDANNSFYSGRPARRRK